MYINKRRPRASNGQRYPLPCCTHFGHLKCAQQGKGYCRPLLALGRLFSKLTLPVIGCSNDSSWDVRGTLFKISYGWVRWIGCAPAEFKECWTENQQRQGECETGAMRCCCFPLLLVLLLLFLMLLSFIYKQSRKWIGWKTKKGPVSHKVAHSFNQKLFAFLTKSDTRRLKLALKGKHTS